MDAPPIIKIGGYNYPTYDLLVIAIGIVAAVVLWAAIYHTKFGVMLRATSQDRRMASALGLNVGLVYVMAFGIGCFMAGLCGGPQGSGPTALDSLGGVAAGLMRLGGVVLRPCAIPTGT